MHAHHSMCASLTPPHAHPIATNTNTKASDVLITSMHSACHWVMSSCQAGVNSIAASAPAARLGSSGNASSARGTMDGTASSSGSMSSGDTMARPSKRSGWLQTLRSCMRQLIMPKKLLDAIVARTSLLER